MKKNYLTTKIFIFLFLFNNVLAKDIPVIVISPGKTIQSLSTVGSTVTVIDGETIRNSASSSLAEIISNESTSTNMFQMGGDGTNTGIQLRGLEKRYSTVYIDGVKMLDPSSPDGSFYMENIMKNSIDRVEILKGTQSSLYGSNAIGGTIHIFTKKGRKGNHYDADVTTGTNKTHNVNLSIDGANEKYSYYVGLNKFVTDGISAMNDNTEDDMYRNDGAVGNFSYNLNENYKIENSFRFASSFLEYDNVAKTKHDDASSDSVEASYALKLLQDKGKLKNSLAYHKLHIERNTFGYTFANPTHSANYFGNRDALNYLGEYNFSLDNKIIFGVDSEFDSARSTESEHDENIISQYFDLQFRPFEKTYATFGLRNDDHTTAGRKTSGRTTLAYLLDSNSKLRSSFGAGVRFPALYDYGFSSSNVTSTGGKLEDVQPERGISYDLGYDTLLENRDLNLSVTLFRTIQKNSINESSARTGWAADNATGVNTSKGIEFNGDWKPENKKFNLGLGYTFTDSFDGSTCSAEEMQAFSDGECKAIGSKVEKYKVRVPRHAVSSKINYNHNERLKGSLSGKYVGETRDFGNGNTGGGNFGFTDQILTDFFVFDLATSYELFDGYNLLFNIGNVMDERYEHAYQYSAKGRSINFGLKRVH